ncbi:hypothetical protein Tco_0458783 [Tanacetum coccineum]
MDNDLFTYEVGILELYNTPYVEGELDNLDNVDLDVYESKVCYDECENIYAEAIIFINKKLVRLIDVTVEKWLDLKYKDHETMDKKVNDSVIATWLVWNYKRQFEDYMKIKRQKEVYGLDEEMEYDPSNFDFAKWLALKFCNHTRMDWYTKNALWIYWTRGDDKELYDSEETNLNKDNKIAKIFRIETNLFDFKTPICNAFKESNHPLQANVDVLIKETPKFETRDKDGWLYKWNNDVPWVDKKPWLENECCTEPLDDITHFCMPFLFKSGHVKWPTYRWQEEGKFNRGDLPGMIWIYNEIHF